MLIKTNKRKLEPTRRKFLRGIFAGSALSIALPPLEVFLNTTGTAYANGSTFPKRFGLFFWGNGMHIDRWVPEQTGTGDEWSLSEQLMPLANVKEDINVITGMEVKVPNTLAHGSGPGGFLTGHEITIFSSESYTVNAPSIDQLIAAEIGGATQFRSLEVAIQREPCAVRGNEHGYSYIGPGTINSPETEPMLLFERLFGESFREPGEEGIVDPKLALRRSVLDAVMEDARRLNDRLGSSDKIRLEQHLDSIRDLEQRIALMESDPPDYEACSRPEAPPELPNIDGRTQMSARSRVMTDLISMAYACDLTRVMSFFYNDEHSHVLFPDATEGHHLLTHNEPGDQPMVNAITKYIMADLAYFIEKMKSVQEGDGTLLDNSLFLATSGVSDGRTHRIDEFPIILAGNAGGRIKNNMHYRSTSKANASHVPYSVMTALDMLPASYGGGEGKVTEGLSDIEV